jgi:hypothetical protein
MKDILTFKRFVTPMAIQILFWIGVAVTVILGVTLIASSRGTAIFVIRGLIWMFVGPIAMRVVCEVLMVLFAMQQRMDEMRDRFDRAE